MKVFCLAAALVLPLTAQHEPTIRIPVRLVSLPVLVFSRVGQLIPGLVAGNFRVYDNDHLQEVVLDNISAPLSAVLAIQVSQEVRSYVPFIAKAGNVIEDHLVGDSGETALITYGDDVATLKTFDAGDLPSTLRKISAHGREARMVDAGLRAISFLKERSPLRARVLLFIGQSMDNGSVSSLASLKERAERENVAVYALTLPQFGSAFVSDTVTVNGASAQEKGGFKAGLDLGRLVAVLRRSSDAEKGGDPFSVLTTTTGGTQLHFRKQRELENAIAAMGVELRSAYVLSYSPNTTEAGFHTISVKVDVQGAKIHSRPGYWLSEN